MEDSGPGRPKGNPTCRRGHPQAAQGKKVKTMISRPEEVWVPEGSLAPKPNVLTGGPQNQMCLLGGHKSSYEKSKGARN